MRRLAYNSSLEAELDLVKRDIEHKSGEKITGTRLLKTLLKTYQFGSFERKPKNKKEFVVRW